MQRYFVNEIRDNQVLVSKEQAHHILNVMRMHVGENITCVFQSHVFLAQITQTSPLNIQIVKELDENHELKNDITLFYCLPKGDKIDLVMQKATELGVKEIILVNSERCIAKIKKEDQDKKFRRFNMICMEASEQSKRSFVPIVNKVINFKEIENYDFDYKFIAYENEKDNFLYEKLKDVKPNQSLAILIGSEGGFSKKEVEFANSVGFSSVSLGKRILKSETAVFYALSVIGFMIEGR